MTCPHCQHQNPEWRTEYCEKCRKPFTIDAAERMEKRLAQPEYHSDGVNWGRRFGTVPVGLVIVGVMLLLKVLGWV